MSNHEPGSISVQSIFGAKTRRGLVVLEVDGHERMMDPAEAQRIARMLMECAEAAESDSIAWHWLSSLLGKDASEQQLAAMLLDWRKMRGQLRQRERLHLEEGGEAARDDLLTRAEVILEALDVSWRMRPPDATARADLREFLMEQLARFRAGEDPEAAHR